MSNVQATTMAIVDGWIAGEPTDLAAVDALAPDERKQLAAAVQRAVRSKRVTDRVDEATLSRLVIKAIELDTLIKLRQPGREQAIAEFVDEEDD